ncbi:MAG: C4-type zinc ribbon domain-containing protein [Candidatus Omnitrophota bacterium]
MTEIAMIDTIKMLIELQELDSAIFDNKRLLDGIPERIKELDRILEEKSAKLKTLEEESKKLQVSHKEKEVELKTKEDTIKKHQAQLYQIKTNKEYAALEKEIGSAKADGSLLEEEIINLLDRIDEIKKNIAKERELLEEEKKKTDEEKKKIESEKKTSESEYNDLNSKRKEFTSKIDKAVLSKYERILHNKDGLAMVPIVDDACGGCNMNLPPQVINEAKLKKDLTVCGNCARILYAKD